MWGVYFQSLIVRDCFDFLLELFGIIRLALHHGHHKSHVGGDLAEEDHWHILKPLRNGDFANIWLGLLLEPEAEVRDLVLWNCLPLSFLHFLFFRFVLLQIFGDLLITWFNIDIVEAFVCANLFEDHFINLCWNNEDRYVWILKWFHERVIHHLLYLSTNKVNILLSFFHIFDIVIQRNTLVYVSNCRVIAHKSHKLLFVLIVGHNAFFDELLELHEPSVVSSCVPLHLIFDELENSSSDYISKLWDQICVLVCLTRDI